MSAICGSNDRLIHEADQFISYIERGSSMLKFYPRKRPERRSVSVRRETHQVIWSRCSGPQRQGYEGALDIKDIKEVRIGKSTKDFERWPEENKRLENSKCFTIFYGTEFKLRSASFAAQTDKDCESWVKGLRYLIDEAISASYPLQIERWLRKEFYAIENSHEKITLKEVKAFLPKINCKISTSKLRDLFQEVDTNKRGEISFDDFAILYQKLIFDENNVHDLFDKYSIYCANGTTITLREFKRFLRIEQHDRMGDNEATASQFIRDYLKDPQRDIPEPYFTLAEVNLY